MVLNNKRKQCLFAVIAFCLINPSYSSTQDSVASSDQNFTISAIHVSGVHRTTEETLVHYLSLRPHDHFSMPLSNVLIHRLMSSGLYRSVSLSREGNVLNIAVVESPVINKLAFRGSQTIPAQELLKAFSTEGIYQGGLLNEAVLKKVIEGMKVEYARLNKEGVDIRYTVTPLSNHTVNLAIFVQEPPYSIVRNIAFTGNQVFASGVLADQLNLREPNFWSWYTKNDRFSWEKLKLDSDYLTRFYKDNGYLDALLAHEDVAFSEERGHVFLGFHVKEGLPYTVVSVACRGSTLVSKKECLAFNQQKIGLRYNQTKVDASVEALLFFLKQKGYAFAVVEAHVEKDPQVPYTVHLYFDVRAGKKYYVRRINISGNTQTADHVLRREFRQYENAYFDATKIERSKERLQRLGFFSSVAIEPRLVPGADDLVDLNLAVKEQPTGSLQFGVGYSSAEKLSFSTSLSYSNLWGTGNAASLALSTSKVQRSLSLSYNNPYWTETGISRGFQLYQVYNNPTSLQVGHYKTLSTGAGITFSVPVNEYDTIAWGLNIDKTHVTVYEDSPDRFKDYVKTFGPDSIALTQTLSFTRDYRDSLIYPTKGYLVQLYGTQTVPGSPLRFYKVGAQFQQYIPLYKKLVLMFGFGADYGDGLGGKPLPFFRNYYAGGIGSVRGYQTNSLGPQDKDGEALGGNSMYTGTVSLLFPVPGMGLDHTLRMSVFLDAGQVFGQGDAHGRYGHFSLADFRYSYGVSLFWLSPIGPLNFSYGIPIATKPWDKEERFQFTLGTTF